MKLTRAAILVFSSFNVLAGGPGSYPCRSASESFVEDKPMRRLTYPLALSLLAVPFLPAAQEKKAPTRTLAGEAAYLTEKSGKAGWVAGDVTLARDGGKETHTGQLSIAFKVRKGAAGLVTLRWRSGKMNGAVGDMGFELVEKDGKRRMNVKDAAGKEVVLSLEYTVEKDVLTIKGAVSKAWTGIFDDEPTKAVAFKPGK